MYNLFKKYNIIQLLVTMIVTVFIIIPVFAVSAKIILAQHYNGTGVEVIKNSDGSPSFTTYKITRGDNGETIAEGKSTDSGKVLIKSEAGSVSIEGGDGALGYYSLEDGKPADLSLYQVSGAESPTPQFFTILNDTSPKLARFSVPITFDETLQLTVTQHQLMTVGFILLFELVAIFLVVGIITHFVSRRLAQGIVKPFDEIVVENGHIKSLDIVSRYPEFAKFFLDITEHEEQHYQFAADVSHELKTPLNVNARNIELLKKAIAKGDRKQIDKALNSFSEKNDELVQVVDTLLRAATLEEDNAALEPTDFTLSDVIDDSIEFAKLSKSEVVVQFLNAADSQSIFQDKAILKEALRGLMTNAAKYHDDKIAVTVQFFHYHNIGKDAKNAVNDVLEIRIENDGQAIPEKDIPFIFNRFHRVDKSRNRKTGGFGIGLALTQKLIYAIGGTIKCESEVQDKKAVTGRTVFSVRVPANLKYNTTDGVLERI